MEVPVVVENLTKQLALATDQLKIVAECMSCAACEHGAKMTLVLMREVEDERQSKSP